MNDLSGWRENHAGTGLCQGSLAISVAEGQLVLGCNLYGSHVLPLAALNLVLGKLGLEVVARSEKPRYVVRPASAGRCENCHQGPVPRFEVPWIGITGGNEGQDVCATCKPLFLVGLDVVEIS